jgi:hypothetical protein
MNSSFSKLSPNLPIVVTKNGKRYSGVTERTVQLTDERVESLQKNGAEKDRT